MALVFSYRLLRMRSPAVPLGGRPTRPKALVPISLIGPQGTRLILGLLDTGADDTVFPDQLAGQLGIDLTGAPEADFGGVGSAPVARIRYAQIRLRLATNTEQREWPAMVGFTSAPLCFPLLGFAGVLQFFDATFRGAREEVELVVNSLYPGN